MNDNELTKLLKVGLLTRELIKALEDLLNNIEDSNNYEIVEEYLKDLIHFSRRFIEKMLPKIKSERN